MTDIFCVKKINHYSQEKCLLFSENNDHVNNNIKKKIFIRKCRMHGGELTNDTIENVCDDSPIITNDDNIKILLDRDIIDSIKQDNIYRFANLLKKSNRYKHIARPLDYNYEGNTVLHECVFWDSNDCILYLIKHSDFNTLIELKNKDGNTALHLMCLKANTVFINELYKLGANISNINNNKETLLHCAVKSGDITTVKHIFSIFDNSESFLLNSINSSI